MIEDKDTLQAEETVEEGVHPEAKEEQPPAPEVVTKADFDKEMTAMREALGEAKKDTKGFQRAADSRGAEAKAAFARIQELQSQIQGIQNQTLSSLDPEEQRIRRLEMGQAQQAQLLQQAGTPQVPTKPTIIPVDIVAQLVQDGINPNDDRIEWGMGDPYGGEARFRASIEHIKADKAKASQVKEAEEESAKGEAEERSRSERGPRETVKVETSGTSASKRSADEIISRYAKGDSSVSTKDYEEALKEKQ